MCPTEMCPSDSITGINTADGFYNVSIFVQKRVPYGNPAATICQQTTTGPTGSPCYTPLDQAIVPCSPETIRKKNISRSLAVTLGHKTA